MYILIGCYLFSGFKSIIDQFDAWVVEGRVDQPADNADTPECTGEKVLMWLVHNWMIFNLLMQMD